MNIIIEYPILLKDVNEFYDLLYDCIFSEMQMPREAMYGNKDLVNAGRKIIARDKKSGKIIGTGAVFLKTPEIGYISYIAVSKNHRKSGIGKIIMEQCERIAQKKGAIKCSLNARIEAAEFYKKIGYKVVKEQVYGFKGHNFTVFEMEKYINGKTKL